MSDEYGEGMRGAQFAAPILPEDHDKPPPKGDGLSLDSLITIGVGVIGIGCVVFTLDWITRSIFVVIAIGLTIFGTVHRRGNKLVRASVAGLVIVGFVALSWRPIWEDFHAKYPTVAVWPWHDNSPQTVPQPKPAPILESRAGKMLLSCASPPGDKKAFEDWKKQFRSAAEIYGDAVGLSILLSDIPKGLKIEVTAKTSEGRLKMGTINKVVIQAQRATDQTVFVVYSWEAMDPLGQFLATMPLDVNAAATKGVIKLVENLVGGEGKCQII